MSKEENKALVRRLVEGWQAGHDPAVAREILADDFVDRSGPVEFGAKEAGIAWFSYMWQAFPDFSVKIKLQIAEEDMVATLKTFLGTHEGEFMGIPPTGRRIAFDVFDMLRVRDGKVVEHWNVEDSASLMKQLGSPETAVYLETLSASIFTNVVIDGTPTPIGLGHGSCRSRR